MLHRCMQTHTIVIITSVTYMSKHTHTHACKLSNIIYVIKYYGIDFNTFVDTYHYYTIPSVRYILHLRQTLIFGLCLLILCMVQCFALYHIWVHMQMRAERPFEFMCICQRVIPLLLHCVMSVCLPPILV